MSKRQLRKKIKHLERQLANQHQPLLTERCNGEISIVYTDNFGEPLAVVCQPLDRCGGKRSLYHNSKRVRINE